MLVFAAAAVFGVIGGLLIGMAASNAVEEPSIYRPVVLPGPYGMESRLHYRHLGDVVEARRQLAREFSDEEYEFIRQSEAA